MYNEQKRAELADLLFAAIDRESQKNESDMNISLVDRCFEFLHELKVLEEFTDDELEERVHKLTELNKERTHRRKSFRIRLIAAIIALFVILGVGVYTFYDEIEELFYTAKPGVRYSNEKFDFEMASECSKFAEIEELKKQVPVPIWIPDNIPEGYEVDYATYASYTDHDSVLIIWKKGNDVIDYYVQIGAPENMIKNFEKLEFNHYSPSGRPFHILDYEGMQEAITVIDDKYYTVMAKNKRLLISIIDTIE